MGTFIGSQTLVPTLKSKQLYGVLIERKKEGCLPWLVYWYYKSTKPVKRYDLVLAPARNMSSIDIQDGELIGKMVVGIPGDTVSIKDGYVYINQKLMGDVFYGTRKNHYPKNYYDKTYQLKPDEIFLFGSEEHTYDSRYWGPYPLSLIHGYITPLF